MVGRLRWLLVLAVVTGGLIVGSLAVGAVRLTPAEVVAALFSPASSPDGVPVTIVRELRLPRALLAALAGAALGAAGAAYQGLFRNPLADPFVVGASSGAALGATLAIVTGWGGLAAGLSPVPLGAFLGALAAAALVYTGASGWADSPLAGLLLAGAAVNSILGAVVWLVMAWDDQDLARIVAWLMGSLSGRGWPELRAVLPWMLAALAGLWLLARPLDALAEGEESARSLGLRVGVAAGLVVAAASLATAAAVAAGGVIGFVGLAAPHLARPLVGGAHAWLVPAAALAGAGLLVLADTLARSVAAPVELPVGVVTALLGGPFFLTLRRHRRT
jgi:iron complex transport system permease protein